MSAAIKIFGHPISQPTRAVIWLCAMKDLPYQLIKIEAINGETRTPEFTKLNPARTIPVLEDPQDNFKLFESHAILTYLCDKNGWNDWYPKELKTRVKIDQYLHWHHQNTRKATTELFRPVLVQALGKAKTDVTQEIEAGRKSVQRFMTVLETLLQESSYLGGTSEPTVADLSCYCELDQLEILQMFDTSPYPRVSEWMQKMKSLPKYEEAHKSLFKLAAMLSRKPKL